MGLLTRFFTGLVFAFSALASTPAWSDEKLALVLSGGGARGGAHLGVLRELEARQIRPDLIVGVSFGALVGGLYAAGMAIDDIESLMQDLTLDRQLQDTPQRGLQTYRQKQESTGNLLNFDLGISADGVKLPLGLLQGQELSVRLASALLPVSNEERFDRLPVPFVAVATDLETGRGVELDRGNLATSIRASLAVPVLFAPVELDGQLLVDGGVANNLPVDVARARGATRVIAVDASMPRLSRGQMTSFVSVVDQITTLLTRANADRQLSRLGPRDYLVVPELGDLGTLEMDRISEAAQAGSRAALASLQFDELLPMGLPQWSQWQASRASRFRQTQAIDSIQVINGSRLNGRAIVNQLTVQPGQILQPDRLESDLRRVYAMGIFERVEADVLEDPAGNKSLEIRTREKSWGPDYFNFGAGIEDNLRGDAAYSFRLSYNSTGQNPTGGELRSTLELGQQPSLAVRFFQPIGYGTPYFAELALNTERRVLRLYDEGDVVSKYLVSDSGIGLDFGRQLSNWGEFRVGFKRSEPKAKLELGSALLDAAGTQASIQSSFAVDTLDSVGFPSSGWRLDLEHVSSRTELGAGSDYETAAARLLLPLSGRFGTVLARIEGADSLSDSAPPERAFGLGGFTRLSGYSPNELNGSSLLLASLTGYQQFSSMPGLGALYRGVSVETGNVFLRDESVSFEDLLTGVSVFLGLDTQLGPMYLSFGASEGGRRSISLTLGRPLGE